MRDIVVPSGDGLRYQYLLARLSSIQCGALLVGPAGCGKSVMVHDSIRAIAVLNLLALLLNLLALLVPKVQILTQTTAQAEGRTYDVC